MARRSSLTSPAKGITYRSTVSCSSAAAGSKTFPACATTLSEAPSTAQRSKTERNLAQSMERRNRSNTRRQQESVSLPPVLAAKQTNPRAGPQGRVKEPKNEREFLLCQDADVRQKDAQNQIRFTRASLWPSSSIN